MEQARSRWESLHRPKFTATFAALDCYTHPLTQAFRPDQLGVDPTYKDNNSIHLTGEPFDVVSMQFCMHYAFETREKAQCMLENVSRYLRKGGVFIGTIPNADFLLYVFFCFLHCRHLLRHGKCRVFILPSLTSSLSLLTLIFQRTS